MNKPDSPQDSEQNLPKWDKSHWSSHRSSRHWHGKPSFDGSQWPKRPPLKFLRLIFGFMVIQVIGVVLGLSFWVSRLFVAEDQTMILWRVGGCGLALALPALAVWLAVSAFRHIARPLGDIMSAADAVASGDLSVRVSEQRPGEFGQLARSFNRMAAELEQADEQRRNLTADVAHELRTPLHIIQGNLEGVLDGVYDPSADHIQDTLEETRLLARLVEDLRTLSLAESGHLDLHLAPILVADLIADLQTSFAGQAESLGVDLHTHLDPRPLTLYGDADRLNQVLNNLMVNALRYTPAGGNISIETTKKGELVQISISDSGMGIEADALPYVFDRFWKADKSRAGTGSGLGLAICKQLVAAHGGDIVVDSDIGKGSTFTIQLPEGGAGKNEDKII